MLGRTTLGMAVATACLVVLPGEALASPFLSGNPIVYARADTVGFTGDARPAELREYLPTTASQPSPRQTIPLTAPGGFAGDAEGSVEYMTRSRNGKYLVVPGYGVTPTTTGLGVELPNPNGTTRVTALVDPAAAIEPHVFQEVVEGALVGAASRDGDQVWMSDSSGAITFRDFNLGGFTEVASTSSGSLGQVGLANAGDGGLFTSIIDIANSLVDIGPDIEDPGQSMTAVPGVSLDETFAFADVSTTTSGDDVLFTSDGSVVNKYSRAAGTNTWTARGTLSLATPLSSLSIQAIAAVVDPATPTIARVFVISTGRLVTFTTTAFANLSANTVTTLANAPAGVVFGGVAPAPQDGPASLSRTVSTIVEDTETAMALTLTDPTPSRIYRVSLTLDASTMTLTQRAGLDFSVGDGVADASMSFQGSRADVRAALLSLRVQGPPNFAGARTLETFVAEESINQSTLATASADFPITITAVNDAPVNVVPGAQTVTEEGTISFSGATKVDVNDVDAATGAFQTVLTAAGGTLDSAAVAQCTVVGDGTSVLQFFGSVSQVKACLAAGFDFDAAANFDGAGSVRIESSDGGNTGTGGAKVDVDTIAITVNPVNDAPTLALPGAQTVAEDSDLALPAVAIADVDSGALGVQVSVSVSGGVLTLNPTDGVSFTAGDGNADASMTLTGAPEAIAAALTGARFRGTPNFAGPASISLTVDDLGRTGAGGAKQATGTLPITVEAVNDAPTLQVPGPQSATGTQPRTFSQAAGTAISVADLDAGSASIRVTLEAAGGTVAPGSREGVEVTETDGGAKLTLRGSQDAVNTALDGTRYAAHDGFDGAGSLAVAVDDEGNSGSGGARSAAGTIPIQVTAVRIKPDVDRDGFPNDVDCNDTNAAINPAAVDRPGNKVDEDCSGSDAAFPLIGAEIRFDFARTRTTLAFINLNVQKVPAGATIAVECKGRGCPFKRKRQSVRRATRQVRLAPLFKRRKLGVGARVQVTVTAPGTIGKVLRLTVRRGRPPLRASLCLAPGASTATRCAV